MAHRLWSSHIRLRLLKMEYSYFRTGPRSPPLPSSSSSSRPRGKSRSRSYSPPRNASGKPGSSSRPPARGRPHTPPTKPVSKSSGGRPKSPCSGSGSESLSSCSDESCSVCSPKHGRRKNSARSRLDDFYVTMVSTITLKAY